MEYDDGTDDIADPVSDRCRRVLDRDFVAVFVNQDRVVVERNYAPVLQTTHDRVFDRRASMLVDDRHDFCDRLAANAAHVKSRQALRNGIDVVDTALGVCRDDTVTDRLQRYLRALFFLKYARFGELAISDVGDCSFVRDDRAIVVVNGTGILEYHYFPTVFAT